MPYALLDPNNTVIQIEANPRPGLIPCPHGTIPGATYHPATGAFTAPPPADNPTPFQQTLETHTTQFFTPFQIACLLIARDTNPRAAEVLNWLHTLATKQPDLLPPPPHHWPDIFPQP